MSSKEGTHEQRGAEEEINLTETIAREMRAEHPAIEAIQAMLVEFRRQQFAGRAENAIGEGEESAEESREQEIGARQEMVAMRGTLDTHPFIEAGRLFAAEYILDAGFKSVGYLGIGSGREAEVLALMAREVGAPLEKIEGIDLAFKGEGKAEKKRAAAERIKSAGPDGLEVEIHGESFADRGFEMPEVEAIYCAITLHDQPQEEQEAILKSAYDRGVKAIIINDVILPTTPNYGPALENDDAREELEDELARFYAEWLQATAASGVPEGELADYTEKIVRMAFPKALAHNSKDEQFETIETLKAKLLRTGFKVNHVQNASGSNYIKVVVAERIE